MEAILHFPAWMPRENGRIPLSRTYSLSGSFQRTTGWNCEGVRPVKAADHAVLDGIDTEWPLILGYNKTIAKPEAVIPVKVEDNPFIALGEYGKGRSAAFTTDCSPHWAPPGFCQWPGYGKIFCNLAKWLTDR